MCTAITFGEKNRFFGRNLDLEYTLGETITITPRHFRFAFLTGQTMESHYAMIGVAYVRKQYPLYYDAVNEKGLCIAGLAFEGNAHYAVPSNHSNEVATFELIPLILGSCKDVKEAKLLLSECKITAAAFDEQLPPAQLHWLIADESECITVEPIEDGLKVLDNPIGVLTNNPPFGYHLHYLNQFLNLSNKPAHNRFSDSLLLQPFSKGMGALGLPGDLSSTSRFVRAAFVKWNSVCSPSETEQITQFFHVLSSVEQQRGCSCDENNRYEITQYTSCCDRSKAIYYYHTYENSQICAVDLLKEEISGGRLITYPMLQQQQICWQNGQ